MTSEISKFRHRSVIALKELWYGAHGEPYHIPGHTLYYVPGTRPVRLKYLNSPIRLVRESALEVQLFSSKLTEGDTVIDVGAHVGVYTMLMAAKCGQTGSVIAFEPDPHARDILKENISLNPELKQPIVECLALSDYEGEATLFSRGGNSQSSLARSAVEFSPEHRSEQIQVGVTTLDAYLASRQISEPRLVKIDAEGAEIRILRGARSLLASRANILCELHPYAWPEFCTDFAELSRLVRESGRWMRIFGSDQALSGDPEYGTVVLDRIPDGAVCR